MINYVKIDELKYKLHNATIGLLGLAEKLCWNKISPNCVYYLSEDPNDGSDIALDSRVLKKSPKEKLKLQTLDEIMPVLTDLYPDIYDIKLFIRQAYRHYTVIDVRYIKWDCDYALRNSNGEPLPFIDASIIMPPFYEEGKKTDVNWQYDTLKHRVELFWWRMKFGLWYLQVFNLKTSR